MNALEQIRQDIEKRIEEGIPEHFLNAINGIKEALIEFAVTGSQDSEDKLRNIFNQYKNSQEAGKTEVEQEQLWKNTEGNPATFLESVILLRIPQLTKFFIKETCPMQPSSLMPAVGVNGEITFRRAETEQIIHDALETRKLAAIKQNRQEEASKIQAAMKIVSDAMGEQTKQTQPAQQYLAKKI